MVDYTKILKDLQVTQEIIRSRLEKVIGKLETSIDALYKENNHVELEYTRSELTLAVAIKDCIDTGDDFLLTQYIDSL